jgi:hypothetical protein
MFGAKPCSYVMLGLALSPNRPKWSSTWALLPRSTIRCVQNDVWAYGMFGANRETILTNTNTISKRTERRFHLTYVTLEFYRVHPKRFLSLQYIWCKPCTFLAPTLTLSPDKLKWPSTWALSTRCTIGCIQIVFWAYGMFGANHAPDGTPRWRKSSGSSFRSIWR